MLSHNNSFQIQIHVDMTIDTITSKINSLFGTIDKMITKMVPMPAILLLCAALNRQGLSVLRSLSNVCKALESLGIPTGSNADGSTNLIVCTCHVLLKEVYRALTEDAVVQGGVQAATTQIMSNGSNSAGPVVSVGTNLLPFSVQGVIQ